MRDQTWTEGGAGERWARIGNTRHGRPGGGPRVPKGARPAAALLALAALAGPASASAQAGSTTVSPYFLVIVDNSGSMGDGTGWGSNSCGQDRDRLSDAKCVLQDVVNGYGEATFGLARFRADCDGRCNSTSCDDSCGCDCTSTCNATARAGEVLVPIRDGNQADVLEWVDYTCSACSSVAPGTQPELHAEGWTPLAGSLRAAREYYQGLDGRFSTSPIASDPFRGCRPYYVILLTDGEETCGGDPEDAATELRSTTVGGAEHDIRTYVIGFGISPGNASIEGIAAAGGTDAPGSHRAFYATDETSLALAFSQIMADAILYEECNGDDDDCDGSVDEGYTLYCDVPGGTSAPSLCTDPGETVCDGVDDNCDGAVDEGLLNACGECGATPAETCNVADDDCDGVIDEGDVCAGCVPSSEICDGVDNDCDAVTDEALSRPCGTDVGACTAGTQSCAGGVWGTCSGTGPTAEVCDGLDNDCDGTIDGISQPCGSDVGACQSGAQLCVGGSWGSCVGALGPGAETCNGLDDDCDGSTDEGNPGGGGACGSSLGACTPGTTTCVGGALSCVGGTGPAPEGCDGVDDDCDGAVDEGIASAGSCGSDTGECAAGDLRCVSGGFSCVGARGPSAEVCDGRDNDCDGSTDEGDPGGGASCGTDVGRCDFGTTRCVGGALTCTGGTSPAPEVCEGTDEDCDGVVDEGNPGGGASCGATGAGECELGALACVDGALACVGETGPSDERCNGLDDDCDGAVDEGDPEGGTPCGNDTGECTAGTTRCTGGELVCMGGSGPTTEICDGLDNDCDGVVDDGIAVGAPCGTDVGECQPGRNVCRDGALVCEGSVGAIDEVCDALDNDCDGAVDEGLAVGEACGTDEGQCVAGTLRCVDGREVCVGAVPPSAETCDCEDDDCDGSVDEAPEGPLCPGESACVDCQCALSCVLSEFGWRCPTGRVPLEQDDGSCYCVAERCRPETCAGETVEGGGAVRCAPDADGVPSCVCKNNACTFPCDGVVCSDGLVCHPEQGRCVPDDCTGLGCPDGQLCERSTGECRDDPCADADCAADQACRDGVCETSCADVACAAGERCVRGRCEADPCAGMSCAAGEVCADGACAPDRCAGVGCPEGTVCEGESGECRDDPCLALRCPDGQRCEAGECAREAGTADAGVGFDGGASATASGDWVFVSGGCAAAGPSRAPPWWLGMLLLMGARFWRRRGDR